MDLTLGTAYTDSLLQEIHTTPSGFSASLEDLVVRRVSDTRFLLMLPGQYGSGAAINAQVWDLTGSGFSRVAHVTSDTIASPYYQGGVGFYYLQAVEWDTSDSTFKVLLQSGSGSSATLVRRRFGYVGGAWQWDNPAGWTPVPATVTIGGTVYNILNTSGYLAGSIGYIPGATDTFLTNAYYTTGTKGGAIVGYTGGGAWQLVSDNPNALYASTVPKVRRIPGSTDQFLIARNGANFQIADATLATRTGSRVLDSPGDVYVTFTTRDTDGYNRYVTGTTWGRESSGTFTEATHSPGPNFRGYGSGLSNAFLPDYPSSADGQNMLGIAYASGAYQVQEWNFVSGTKLSQSAITGYDEMDDWALRVEAVSPDNAVVAYNQSGTLTLRMVGPAPVVAQTITFPQPADTGRKSGPVTLTGSSSSGLAVAYSSATTSVCTVSGSTVSLLTTGTCTIHADQAGDSTYSAAPQVTKSFTVTPAYIYTAHYSWTAPEDDGGCAIDRYRAVDTTTGAVIYDGEDTTFNHGSIDLDNRNAVKVKAHNCRGWGPWSTPSKPAKWTG